MERKWNKGKNTETIELPICSIVFEQINRFKANSFADLSSPLLKRRSNSIQKKLK